MEETQSLESLDLLVRSTSVALIGANQRNQITCFNPAAEMLWGYGASQVIGHHADILLDGDHFERLSEQNKPRYSVSISCNDHRSVLATISLTSVGQQGWYAFVFRTHSDEQHETNQSILHNVVDAIVTIDEKRTISFFNAAAEQLWGFRSEQILGQDVDLLFSFDELLQSSALDAAPEIQIERTNGDRIWARLSLSRILIDQRTIYTVIAQDTTQQREFGQMVRQTLEQTNDAVVTINENNEVTFFNEAAEKLWGYTRADVTGRNVKMLVPQMYQMGHDRFVETNRTTGNNKIVGTSRVVPLERTDGTELWVNLSLSKIDLDHKILYTAFLQDVTEQRTQAEKFKIVSLVADKTSNSVVICDANRKIEYVNEGFTQLTGYTAEEAIGRNPGELLQGKHTDPETVARIRKKLNDCESFYEEILNYNKAGEPYWVSLSVNPVFDDAGKLIRYVSVQADIHKTKSQAVENDVRLQTIGRANALVEFDCEGKIVYANDYFQTCCQFDEGVHSAPNLRDLIPQEKWNSVMMRQTVTHEVSFATVNGSVDMNVVLAGMENSEKRLTKILMCGVNITERNQIVSATRNSLSEIIARISKIVGSVNRISNKTKLVSLNATIEAARVGEEGKGFAVVAEEVRTLAVATSDAAGQIFSLIDQIKENVDAIAK